MHEGISPAESLAGSGSSSPEKIEPLATVRFTSQHRAGDFCCERSERVVGFLRTQAPEWERKNYCRVFVLEDRADPHRILGFYTLSPALMLRADISTQHQKKAIPGIPVPLVRIGFMGRDDSAEKGLGAGLIVDAARRVSRILDLPAWGLVLDAEGGAENTTLVDYYERNNFRKSKDFKGVMYGPLKSFLPELPFH